MIFACSIAEGGGLTVFQGNLLECDSSRNEIALLHSRFNTTSAATNGTCNNGRVHGYSLPINDSEPCYISQLYVMVNPDMIGKSIKCAYDNGTTAKEIGNFSIEQCHAMAVTIIALSTGKLVIHVGIIIYKMVLISFSNIRVYMDSNRCLRKQYNHIQRYIYSLQHTVGQILNARLF